MIVVTGAAGFIGSCVVSKLNQAGHEDLLLVDHYDHPQDAKKKNLEQKKYIRFIEKEDFIGQVAANQIKENITYFGSVSKIPTILDSWKPSIED